MKRILKIAALILFSPVIVLIVLIMIPISLVANLIDIPFRKRRLQRLKEDISTNWLPNKKYLYIRYHSNSELASFVDTDIMEKYSEHIVAYRWNEDENKWDDSTWSGLSSHSDKTLFQDVHPDSDDAFDMMVTYIDPSTKEFSEECLELFPTGPGLFAIDNTENQVAQQEAEKTVADFVKESLSRWQ